MSALGIEQPWSSLPKEDQPTYHAVPRKSPAAPPWEVHQNHPIVPLIRSGSQLTEIEHDGLQQFWIAEDRSRSNSVISTPSYHYSPRQTASGWNTPGNQSCQSSSTESRPYRPASATGHSQSRQVYIPPAPKSNPEKPSFVIPAHRSPPIRQGSIPAFEMNAGDRTRINAPAGPPRQGMPLSGATMSSRQAEKRSDLYSYASYADTASPDSTGRENSPRPGVSRQYSGSEGGSQSALSAGERSMSQSSAPQFDRQPNFTEQQRKMSLGGFSAGQSPTQSLSHPPLISGPPDHRESPSLMTRDFDPRAAFVPRPQDRFNPDMQPGAPGVGQRPKELEDLVPDDSWRRKASVDSNKEKAEPSSRLGSKFKQQLKTIFKPGRSKTREEERNADSPSDTHTAFE